MASAPHVGASTTSETPVPGITTGANHLTNIPKRAGLAAETAKEYTGNRASFYSLEEFEKFTREFGTMTHLQR